MTGAHYQRLVTIHLFSSSLFLISLRNILFIMSLLIIHICYQLIHLQMVENKNSARAHSTSASNKSQESSEIGVGLRGPKERSQLLDFSSPIPPHMQAPFDRVSFMIL